MTIHPHFPDPTPAELPPPEAFPPATRADGWTPERQRRFLESIAEGHTVEERAASLVCR